MRYIGVYAKEEEAAYAWDMEAVKLRGMHATKLNFPHLEDHYRVALRTLGMWPPQEATASDSGAEAAIQVTERDGAAAPSRSGSKRKRRPSVSTGGEEGEARRRAPKATDKTQEEEEPVPVIANVVTVCVTRPALPTQQNTFHTLGLSCVPPLPPLCSTWMPLPHLELD